MTSRKLLLPASVVPETPGGELSTFRMAEALFRHLAMFLVVAGTVLALALCWIFATPRRYESRAGILVQNSRSNVLITPGAGNAPTLVQEVTEEQLNSELEVLMSKDLMDEVVDPDWRTRARSSISKAEMAKHEGAVSSLTRRLDANVGRRSDVIDAKITAPTPEEAQDEMQRLVAGFIAMQREIGRPAGATRFFVDEAARYEKELVDAQQAMAKFQKDRKLVSLNDRENTLSSKLTTADNLRREADVEMSDLQNRIDTDTQLLATVPTRQATQERTVPLSGALDQLTTRLVTLQNQLAEALMKYKPTDRTVKVLQEQISETEEGIRAAHTANTQDSSTDINPTWQRLQTDLTILRTQLNGVKARRKVLTDQINETQTALNSIEDLSPEFTRLQNRINELEGNYQMFVQKRNEAQIADSMDRQDILNFRVVQSPTYSMDPVHPKPLRDTLLGIITALLAGGVAVFFFESGRDTFSTAGELERWSNIPVLATMPWRQNPDVELATAGSGVEGEDFDQEAEVALSQHLQQLSYLRSAGIGRVQTNRGPK